MLHDIKSQDEMGAILITDKNDIETIKEKWLEFQSDVNSDTTPHYDIWDFVNEYPRQDFHVVEIEFYQP